MTRKIRERLLALGFLSVIFSVVTAGIGVRAMGICSSLPQQNADLFEGDTCIAATMRASVSPVVCKEVTKPLKHAVKSSENILACLPVGVGNWGFLLTGGPGQREKNMSIINVGNASALSLALKSAQAGDTILLAAGDYGAVSIKNMTFSQPVTITSKDPGNIATISELELRNVTGLTFQNLEFDNTGSTKRVGSFEVFDSSNISFDHLKVHGSLDGDATNDVDGFRLNESSNISVTNSEFQQLRIGLGHNEVDGLTVSNNYFHDLRMDGVRGNGSSHVLISKNAFSNFRHIEGDHSDAIQFYGTGTDKVSTDIKILDNIMVQGDGEVFQGVFMRQSDLTKPFTDVLISGNLVVEGNHNGISVNGGKNVTIDNNTVLAASDHKNWISVENSDTVRVSANEALLFGFEAVTNLLNVQNFKNQATTDGGASESAKWMAEHPDFHLPADLAARLAGGVSETPPIVQPQPQEPVQQQPVPQQPAPQGPVLQPEPEHPGPVAEQPSGAETLVTNLSATLTSVYQNVTLTGGNAVNVIGNAQDNVIWGNSAKNQLSGQAGADSIHGGGANDTVLGDGGNDQLFGDDGNDEMLGSTGNDSLWGGDGKDNLAGQDGNDLIYGDAGDDRLYGHDGQDVIYGGVGDDRVWAGRDADTVYGGDGADAIAGDQGNDVLWGGSGADQFKIEKGFDVDRVMDFSLSDGDTVKVEGAYTVSHVGADTIVQLASGDQMVLVGVDLTAKGGWILAG